MSSSLFRNELINESIQFDTTYTRARSFFLFRFCPADAGLVVRFAVALCARRAGSSLRSVRQRIGWNNIFFADA